jgi:hypothetical protein
MVGAIVCEATSDAGRPRVAPKAQSFRDSYGHVSSLDTSKALIGVVIQEGGWCRESGQLIDGGGLEQVGLKRRFRGGIVK